MDWLAIAWEVTKVIAIKAAKAVIPAIVAHPVVAAIVATVVVVVVVGIIVIAALTPVPIPDKPIWAIHGDAPYHVSIQYNGQHICSGGLISNQHVLTLAACVKEFTDEKELKLRLKIFVSAIQVPDGGKYHQPAKIDAHGYYVENSFEYDIAVVRLDSKVVINNYAKTIELPLPGRTIEENHEIFVSGYAPTSSQHAGRPSTLRRINMTVAGTDTCKKNQADMNNMFCAVSSPGYKSCVVDHGGAAAVDDKQRIIGIYAGSNIEGCGKKEPEYFVAVSKHVEFIKHAMG